MNIIQMQGISFFLASLLAISNIASSDDGLVGNMGKLQYFTHKTGLSLKAGNQKLAAFYIHELEEAVEDLVSFGQYKKFDIGKMTKKILLPEFKQFEQAFKMGDPAPTWKAFITVIESCNTCHRASRHGFINIKFNEQNPYMQTFEK